MSRMRRGGSRSWVRSCGYAPECVVWSLLRLPIEGEVKARFRALTALGMHGRGWSLGMGTLNPTC